MKYQTEFTLVKKSIQDKSQSSSLEEEYQLYLNEDDDEISIGRLTSNFQNSNFFIFDQRKISSNDIYEKEKEKEKDKTIINNIKEDISSQITKASNYSSKKGKNPLMKNIIDEYNKNFNKYYDSDSDGELFEKDDSLSSKSTSSEYSKDDIQFINKIQYNFQKKTRRCFLNRKRRIVLGRKKKFLFEEEMEIKKFK